MPRVQSLGLRYRVPNGLFKGLPRLYWLDRATYHLFTQLKSAFLNYMNPIYWWYIILHSSNTSSVQKSRTSDLLRTNWRAPNFRWYFGAFGFPSLPRTFLADFHRQFRGQKPANLDVFLAVASTEIRLHSQATTTEVQHFTDVWT